VGNTSKLTEPERAALIDLIVQRLQKPMTEAGYDDQRIREIASTTRLRFLELGEGRPLVLAASIGLEGGCDSSGNCPLWIFRREAATDGYVSVLDTEAATYSVQPTTSNGFSDLVTLRRTAASQGNLTVYRYNDRKYVDAGCYTAIWPPPKDEEVQDPEIVACKAEEANKPEEPVKTAEPATAAEPVKTVGSDKSAEPNKSQEPEAGAEPAVSGKAAEPSRPRQSDDALPAKAAQPNDIKSQDKAPESARSDNAQPDNARESDKPLESGKIQDHDEAEQPSKAQEPEKAESPNQDDAPASTDAPTTNPDAPKAATPQYP
jgi:hypothetical protein